MTRLINDQYLGQLLELFYDELYESVEKYKAINNIWVQLRVDENYLENTKRYNSYRLAYPELRLGKEKNDIGTLNWLSLVRNVTVIDDFPHLVFHVNEDTPPGALMSNPQTKAEIVIYNDNWKLTFSYYKFGEKEKMKGLNIEQLLNELLKLFS
ncbi:hypothetical protein [Neisseria sp. Ec49-e6-T10]|uniref:hypothetical protein n=1 Tax=Neisseria sp. Ec49-e6-T10 TaxID=3140744 RepID=UPI003EB9398B